MKRSHEDTDVIVLDSDEDAEPAGGPGTAANNAVTAAPTPKDTTTTTTSIAAASDLARREPTPTSTAPGNAAFNSFKDIVMSKIYELFPDIGHKYVSGIYDALQDEGRDPDAFEALMVDKIFEKKTYPKKAEEKAAEEAEEKERAAKRPRLDEGERKNWNESDGVRRDRDYHTIAWVYLSLPFNDASSLLSCLLAQFMKCYGDWLSRSTYSQPV